MRAKDAVDALRMLSRTIYSDYLAGIAKKEAIDILNLEKVLMQSYYETFERIIGFTDGITQRILTNFFEKHEAVCFKSLLRMVLTRSPADKSMDYIVPVGRYTPEICRGAISTSDPRKVAALAWDDDLRNEILDKLPECEKYGSSLPAEAVIEKYVFEKIWNNTDCLDGMDLKNVQKLVGTEIDATNMMLIVRAIYFGVNQEITKALLVPIQFRIGDLLDKALVTMNPFEAIRILSRGAYHIDSAVASESEVSKSLLPWELALRRMIAHESSSLFLGYPLQMAIPMAFLNLKFFEIGDIKTILVGKRSGVDPSRVANNLITYHLR